MAKCDVRRITAKKLCLGDLRHLVGIQSRELDESGFDTSQPVETFTQIRQQWCAIETVSGVSKFSKINIEDDATHLFWCFWDVVFPDLETGNNYMLHDGRRFKVLKVDNVNERNLALMIQTTERGESSEAASDA